MKIYLFLKTGVPLRLFCVSAPSTVFYKNILSLFRVAHSIICAHLANAAYMCMRDMATTAKDIIELPPPPSIPASSMGGARARIALLEVLARMSDVERCLWPSNGKKSVQPVAWASKVQWSFFVVYLSCVAWVRTRRPAAVMQCFCASVKLLLLAPSYIFFALAEVLFKFQP